MKKNDKEYELLVAELMSMKESDLYDLVPFDYQVTVYSQSNPQKLTDDIAVNLRWAIGNIWPVMHKPTYTSNTHDSVKEGLATILACMMLEDITQISKQFP